MNMADYNKILEKITTSIISKDYNALSDSLDHAYNTCPRSGKYKSAICFGYQHLAKQSGMDDPEEAVVAFDRARQMCANDRELMSDEAYYFSSYINTYNKELNSSDLDLFNKTIELIISCTPKSAQLKAQKAFESVLDNIHEKHPNLNIKSDGSPIIAQELLKHIMHDLLDNSEYDILSDTLFVCEKCDNPYVNRVNDITTGGMLQFACEKGDKYCPLCGNSGENYVSSRSFAKIIDCAYETVKKWVQSGKLKSYKFGGMRRIPVSEVERIKHSEIPSFEELS